jgi:hypothetical protein
MELTTELFIGAPPAIVWSVLVDFERYPEWNPFIVELKGRPVVGSRLEARIVPPGTKGMRFRPIVRAVTPERELRWKGNLALPGLFSGEHSFRLEPHELGTRFVQSERFGGLLVVFFRSSLDSETRRGFEEMNHALRERCEAIAGDAVT